MHRIIPLSLPLLLSLSLSLCVCVCVYSYISLHSYDKGSEQYQWIESDLAAARNSSEVSWIFLTGHRPMYASHISLSLYLFFSFIQACANNTDHDHFLFHHIYFNDSHPLYLSFSLSLPISLSHLFVYLSLSLSHPYPSGTRATLTSSPPTSPVPISRRSSSH